MFFRGDWRFSFDSSLVCISGFGRCDVGSCSFSSSCCLSIHMSENRSGPNVRGDSDVKWRRLRRNLDNNTDMMVSGV
jgi:hypothetical protein